MAKDTEDLKAYEGINEQAARLAWQAYSLGEELSGDPGIAFALMQQAQTHWLNVLTARQHLKIEMSKPMVIPRIGSD